MKIGPKNEKIRKLEKWIEQFLISKFWPLGEGFQGFCPQIRLQQPGKILEIPLIPTK